MKVILNNFDITGMVSSISISGSTEKCARQCDVTYINAPYDENVSALPTATLSDYITVIDEDTEVFYGRVTGREKSSQYGTVTANCIEDCNLLLNVQVKYSFSNKTPEEIAAQILADYQFPVGSLAATGVAIPS